MKRYGKFTTLWIGMMAITTTILVIKGVDVVESFGWAVIAATTKSAWSHMNEWWWKLPRNTGEPVNEC
jgi:hypothetical protein